MPQTMLFFFVVIGGALIPIQAAINASLAKSIGYPILAATLSTFISFSSLIIIALSLRLPLTTFNIFILPWWMLISGGIIGAYLVFISLSAAPVIGVTTLFAGLLTGQLLVSIILDHFGLIGIQQDTLNLGKSIGVLLLVTGVYFIKNF